MSIATWLLLAVLLAAPAHAADATPADLVLVRKGTLPIILTAPHGGRDAIPGIDPRRAADTTSQGWGGFVTGSDSNTDLLAQRIASQVATLTGREPYLIVAKYQRKYIDANRPSELALQDSRARPYYDYYHRTIRRFVDEIRASHPAGLLIDVHGQSKDPDAIMRGTLNGRAVERLLRRAGVDAVTGPRSMFGQLEANGFKVFPPNDVSPRGTSEDAGFKGGYTVFTYGSHNPDGIDALQLEVGATYRRGPVLDKSAHDVARAIAVFCDAYLKSPERP